MGSNGVEDREKAQPVRPSISFSRCRSRKTKLRSAVAAASKDFITAKLGSKINSASDIGPCKPSKRQKLVLRRQQNEKQLEELERSFFQNAQTGRRIASATAKDVSGPPIPSFILNGSDDDDDDLLSPVLLGRNKPCTVSSEGKSEGTAKGDAMMEQVDSNAKREQDS